MSFGKRIANTARGFVNGGPIGAAVGFAANPSIINGSGAATASNYGGSYSYNTPFARITYKNNSANYQPFYTADQRQGMTAADQGSLSDIQQLQDYSNPNSQYQQALGNLPTDLNINDYYNNPFRQSTYNVLSQPIVQHYHQDQQQLSDSLNAQNQNGGSYAALRYNQLDQNLNQSLSSADQQAIQSSANAYNQLMNQKYQNLNAYQQYYTGLQSNLSGLQNYYNTLKNQGSVLPYFFKK